MQQFTIENKKFDLEKSSLEKHAPKDALAALVNKKPVDLSYLPENGDSVQWITRTSEPGLEIIRHDTAHILAQALKEIWGDDISIAIGPTIQDGFYYDFLCKTPLSTSDFAAIEKKMRHIVKRNDPITRMVWSREEALLFFEKKKEPFKVELVSSIPEGELISFYQQGDFVDLCRGPHAPSTHHAGAAFKLLRIAGAYWRGDSKNVMLQRIYGTAWTNQEDLNTYLKNIEEAKLRDHRTLGAQADLFVLSPKAKGSVFWLPDGWFVFRKMQEFIRSKLEETGYQEVNTPLFYDKNLWAQSGHLEKFAECMYMLEQHSNDPPSSLKPMNCPAHVILFNSRPRTYKDLPLRLSEFGSCSRHEPSGSLFGIMRLRQFTQDDAHIFCTPEQVHSEARNFCELLFIIYKAFGFHDIKVFISTRPENALGSQDLWDRAEQSLIQIVTEMGIPFQINHGEGAFYGPKIEFVLKDALNRPWQCGTLQLDYVLPQRLEARYIDEDNTSQTPIMLHRAILGSLERFLAILIEDRKGILPTWLAPIQAAILTISQETEAYGEKCLAELKGAGIRTYYNNKGKPISSKLKSAIDRRIPFIISVGKNEMQNNTVSLKKLGESGKSSTLTLQEVKNLILKECSSLNDKN